MAQLYSALFVDFDNVASELFHEGEQTASRFGSQPGKWLEAIRSSLALYPAGEELSRSVVARRCYASPHRINKFRPDFTRAGFEVIDCPPLTAKMKNSADIYMVMDILEYVDRYQRISEYIILSADADFTPVLNRLRKELKYTVIFSATNTASSYKNCSDQQVAPAFFSDALNVTTAVARPRGLASDPMDPPKPASPPPAAQAKPAAPSAEANPLSQVVERCLLEQSTVHGKAALSFAFAGMVLRSAFPQEIGENWAGKGTLSKFLRSASFETLRIDWERNSIHNPTYRPSMSGWPADDQEALSEFIGDVAQLCDFPILSPDQNLKILECLSAYWARGEGTVVGSIKAVLDACADDDTTVTQSDVRSIVTGIMENGVAFGPETGVAEMANALRLHIFDRCDEPDWMREPSEVARLVYWIRGPTEGDTVVEALVRRLSLADTEAAAEAN